MNEYRADTWFAPAQRSSTAELARDIGLVTNHPLTDTLLRAVDGLAVVINDHRQIIAVNRAFLELLNLDEDEADGLLGLRPGEALACVHAEEEPHGCGTARACATCGAVRTVLAAQREDRPVEGTGVLALRSGEGTRDLVVRIRACPVEVSEEQFILVFIQDVTGAHRLANLEHTFLHDFNNLLQGLQVSAELVATENDPVEMRSLGRHVMKLTRHLGREVELQRSLLRDDPAALRLSLDQVPLAQVQAELRRVFRFHPAARGRQLHVARDGWDTWIRTDPWVLTRILTNLVLNALEATEPGGRAEVHMEPDPDGVTIRVWNRGTIPPEIRPRIFQRNFSSKEGRGRGLGTFSVKLLGETLLGARVDFTTSTAAGTEFRVRLPR